MTLRISTAYQPNCLPVFGGVSGLANGAVRQGRYCCSLDRSVFFRLHQDEGSGALTNLPMFPSKVVSRKWDVADKTAIVAGLRQPLRSESPVLHIGGQSALAQWKMGGLQDNGLAAGVMSLQR